MAVPGFIDEMKLTEFTTGAMVYFEKHKIMDILVRIMAEMVIMRPENPRKYVYLNIRRIAREVYEKCMNSFYNIAAGGSKFYQLPTRFLYRICIFGRHGSGRKTQAFYLVERYSLLLIDAEILIYEYLQKKHELGEKLRCAFESGTVYQKSEAVGNIINHRLLQADAIYRGWVLINYPNVLCEFRNMFENFSTPPNKLIYITVTEKIAKRRLLSKPPTRCRQDNVKYIEMDAEHFNEHEEETVAYMRERFETIIIDGTPCSADVKNKITTQVERSPYFLGYKH